MPKHESSAEMCRRLGWDAGTRLTGICADGKPADIEITAIGNRLVLVVLACDGRSSECNWDLTYGTWTKISVPAVTIPDEVLWGERGVNHAP